ncbi:hypothetical protein FG386_002228 [Cryptosporidium ryanae]|uniref:uncharacterized protein n=1 Tax=Cryptosporidium ryanae TaxID=515981 RepID=UPI00351A0CE2|nr:hypothetical protein FG386_002228 [Cryptosporidium ryanae]
MFCFLYSVNNSYFSCLNKKLPLKELIIVLLLFLITSKNSQTLRFRIDNSEFQQSWHFFENHNSLEGYKYGFLLNSLQNNNKYLYSEYMLEKHVLLNLEENIIEINEKLLWLLSFPVIKLYKDNTNNKFTSIYKLCQLKQPKHDSGERVIKTNFNIITLELKDGKLIRLLVVFKKIGIWLNFNHKIQMYNHTEKFENLHRNKEENCDLIGTESKETFRLNSTIPNKFLFKKNITIPTILFNSKDSKLSIFLQSNNIDGIFGINNNLVSLKKDNEFLFDPLEAISKEINSNGYELLLSFDCKKIESITKEYKATNKFIVSTIKNKNSKYLDGFESIKPSPFLNIFIDYEPVMSIKSNIVIDLSLFGAEIPKFRLIQIFSILKKRAVKEGNTCNIIKTLFGDAIQCDCKFLMKQTPFKIIDSNFGTYDFNLSDFTIQFDNIKGKKATREYEKCILEIYGKKSEISSYRERWIFGQVFCKSKNVSKLKKKGSANSWEIEGFK